MMTIEEEILSYLRVEPETALSRRDLVALTGCLPGQTQRGLIRLKEKGIVECVGKTNGARWRVTP